MWHNTYKDCPHDTLLKKEEVSPGKGIIGCEMHERNGWGDTHRRHKKQPKGMLSMLFSFIFRTKIND
jgi:hypothetical protein